MTPMTFDQGRPMHVFDAAKVKGNLTVRRAKDGETVLALDQREYKLSPNNVVISDDDGIESIGGIMMGAILAIKNSVIFVSAFFI